MFVKKIDTNPEGTDASDFQSERGAVGAAEIKINKNISNKVRVCSERMPRNLFRGGSVPRSLISQWVKSPSVLFTRQTFFHKESLIKETGF